MQIPWNVFARLFLAHISFSELAASWEKALGCLLWIKWIRMTKASLGRIGLVGGGRGWNQMGFEVPSNPSHFRTVNAYKICGTGFFFFFSPFPCWSTSLESQSSGHGWGDVRQKLQAWNIFPCIHLSSRPGGAELFIEFILILEAFSYFLSAWGWQLPLMSILGVPSLKLAIADTSSVRPRF